MSARIRWRPRAVHALGLLALSSALVREARAGDFNPEGRRRKPAPATATPPASPSRKSAESEARPENKGPSPAASHAGSGSKPSAETGSSEALIARYLGILQQDPGAEFPLERLVQLYRQRDGN